MKLKFKLLLLALMAGGSAMAQYAPAGDRIKTEWADKVTPENVWQEYPRPLLVRQEWKNLNGLWKYSIKTKGEKRPSDFDGDILVPFCIESSLSGVQKTVGPDSALWYSQSFTVPNS